MNAARRKELAKARAAYEEAERKITEGVSDLENALSILETCKDEEQEYFDNMPESLQSSEKGQAAESSVSSMEEALSQLQEVIDNMPDLTTPEWDAMQE